MTCQVSASTERGTGEQGRGPACRPRAGVDRGPLPRDTRHLATAGSAEGAPGRTEGKPSMLRPEVQPTDGFLAVLVPDNPMRSPSVSASKRSPSVRI